MRLNWSLIERLGDKCDREQPSHLILPDGLVRDTVVYSILKHEWAGVKANLEFKLKRAFRSFNLIIKLSINLREQHCVNRLFLHLERRQNSGVD